MADGQNRKRVLAQSLCFMDFMWARSPQQGVKNMSLGEMISSIDVESLEPQNLNVLFRRSIWCWLYATIPTSLSLKSQGGREERGKNKRLRKWFVRWQKCCLFVGHKDLYFVSLIVVLLSLFSLLFALQSPFVFAVVVLFRMNFLLKITACLSWAERK